MFIIVLVVAVATLVLMVGLDVGQIDPRVSKDFKLSEFASPDTGKAKMDMEVILKLQEVRDHFGKPVVILSAYRTPKHNKDIGGEPDSLHMDGMAVDWYVKGVSAKEMARVARKCGFTGIGIYDTWVHTDIGEEELWYGE